MSNSLAKKPASAIRVYTQQARDHAAAMQRAQEQYFSALGRAQTQYFETVSRITKEFAKATEPIEGQATAPAEIHPAGE